MKKELEAYRNVAAKKILLALDVSTIEEANRLSTLLGPHVGGIKIGLEAITGIGGPEMRETVHNAKGDCFYDGKFNDIPNTTGKSSIPLGSVKFFNVHASSGNKSIKAAVDNCGDAKVLVVTVLTSIPADECMEIFGDTPANKVLQFARKGKANGAHGVICSAQELSVLAVEDLKGFTKVIPGIQPLWMQKNDQQRTMTPYEAIMAGADYLVIGRAITEHTDPLLALNMIIEEIAEALYDLDHLISI